jgi:hypothetical protein
MTSEPGQTPDASLTPTVNGQRYFITN